jgi:hypothetical protein
LSFLQNSEVLDAIRVKDGARVVLKRVPVPGRELNIALSLSSTEMRSDPRNHTVPIFDVVTLPDNKDNVLLVMPHLRIFNTPPFHCRGEVVEALRQFLQVCNPYIQREMADLLFICRVSSSRMNTTYPMGAPNL